MRVQVAEVRSPIGTLTLASGPRGLVACEFDLPRGALADALARRHGDVAIEEGLAPGGASARLEAYLGGALGALEEIPVEPAGTPFQLRVWEQLRRIPAGRTWSYRDLAIAIGQPSATRAVGLANGRNPVAVVIPCHRVIGSSGALTGYGGGLARKRWLLEHEGVLLPLAT